MHRFQDGRLGHDAAGVTPLRSDELLALPVCLHRIQLGRPVDLLLDRTDLKVLGFDVLCGDDVHRFLPLPTAVVRGDEITIRSPLVLLEEDELAFYQARAFGLTSLRGTPVDRAGRHEGRLKDVAFLADGALTELVVEDEGAEIRLPFDAGLRIDTGSRSAA